MTNSFGIKKITSYHPNSVYIRSCLLCTFTGECHFYKKNVLSMLSTIFKSIISILNVFLIKTLTVLYISWVLLLYEYQFIRMGFECVFYISACNVACNGCTGPGPDACVNCADQFYRVGTTCRGTQVHHVHIYILLKFIRTKESCFFCDHCFKVKSKERYLKKAIKFTPYFISRIVQRVLCQRHNKSLMFNF